MVKFLLLALAFGLANAHHGPKISEKWVTVAIAADNVEKIEDGKEMRLYTRGLSCNKHCTEMDVTFYVNANGQCSKTTVTGYRQEDGTYQTQFEGDNRFKPVQGTAEYLAFLSTNVDRSGLETNLVYILGKGNPLTPEQHAELEEFVEEHGIPAENIRDVLATDAIRTRIKHLEVDNRFEPVHETPEYIVVLSKNVDRSGLETNLVYVLGKGKPLTPEEHAKLEEFVEEHGIPAENIREVLATDTCPN